MKSRKLHRNLKEQLIQEENDLLVERLLDKRKNPSELAYRLKKPNKRSHSVMLPQISTPSIPELRS